MNRRQLSHILKDTLEAIPRVQLQSSPFLPDVLYQPDFLVVPTLGRLVAVYIFSPRQRLGWRDTLAIVEDLFEIKQATGESTVAVAILIPAEPMRENDAIFYNLLHNLFDGFLTLYDFEEASAKSEVAELVKATTARESLFQLWRNERSRVAHNFKRFSEERYAPLVDRARRSSRSSKSGILRQLKSEVAGESEFAIRERYEVRSPKEPLADLPERNKFRFDFGVESLPLATIRPVDVAVLDRYGSRTKLRYLMTKARLTSYAPWEGRLRLREEPIRPVLLVSGNLAGPEHDPYRYVRALVSVGWELAFATPESMRDIAHADI